MATSLAAPPQDELSGIVGADEQEQFGGDGFPELPDNLQKTLKSLLRKALQRELYARRQEVMGARKQRFYDRGVQYIYWDYNSWGFAPLTGAGAGDQGNGSYEDVYNIYHPFLRALVAAGTANPPGVHIEARTNKTADTIGAEAADLYREFVEQANDIKRVQTEIWRLFCTDGTVISEAVKSKADPQYGVDEDGEPLEAELMELSGVLERKVPITQNEMKDWVYCILSREFEIESLQADWPNAVDSTGESLIKDSGDAMGESSYERMARIGVLQGTRLITASGETFANLVTRHRGYFRPEFFRAAPKDERKQLEEIFPKGCLLVVCGDAYCASYDVSMDERLSVAHSTPGDGQNRSSLMHDMVGPQDTFNDCWNQQKEIFDYCIPDVYMDSNTLDAMAREERKAEPGAEIPVVLAPGESIEQKVLFGQNVEVPQTLVLALNTLSGSLGQLITGMYSAAQGEGDEHQETAKGLTILKESSLGQVGIAWGASQQLIASAIEQCIRLAASTRDSQQKIAVRPAGTDAKSSKEVEIANIQKGNWYGNVDTSYPDTKAMKRAIFTSLVQMAAKSPAIEALLSLPENQELFKEFVGIEGFEVPGAAADLQQRREIEELLKSGPAEPTPEQVQQGVQQELIPLAQQAAQHMQQTGQPVPPPPPEVIAQLSQKVTQQLTQPTVPIDPVWDFHQQHIQTIQDWLASQDRFDEEAKGNFPGIENVKLHGMAHKQALAAAQQPPQGKPPSVSINFSDLPSDGKIQAAKEAGITLNPAIMAASDLAQHAAENAKSSPLSGGPPSPK
jgi:hypothetical protein